METINKRFKELRIATGNNQESFGKCIGISKSGVSDIESGRRNVTEQHIIMLINCTDLHVNERWLRTGEGEKFIQLDKELELMEWAGRFLADESDTFRKRFIRMMMSLDESQWEFLESKVKELFL